MTLQNNLIPIIAKAYRIERGTTEPVAVALAEHIIIPAKEAANLVGVVGSQINTSFTTEAISSKVLSHFLITSFPKVNF